MTNEAVHTALKERMVLGMPENILCHNASLNNQLQNGKVGGHITLCFQLCSAHYTALQMKNSMRSISAINPAATENTSDRPQGSASCYCESTPYVAHCVVSEKSWNTKEDKYKSTMYVL